MKFVPGNGQTGFNCPVGRSQTGIPAQVSQDCATGVPPLICEFEAYDKMRVAGHLGVKHHYVDKLLAAKILLLKELFCLNFQQFQYDQNQVFFFNNKTSEKDFRFE